MTNRAQYIILMDQLYIIVAQQWGFLGKSQLYITKANSEIYTTNTYWQFFYKHDQRTGLTIMEFFY